MFGRSALAFLLLSSAAMVAASPSINPKGAATPAQLVSQCAGKSGYSDPAPPVHIYGNTYYVGTCGISSILIAGPSGDILIDGATKDAPPLILANLQRLGVRPKDVRILLNTHEHYDHVGGLAELKRLTGARVYARAVSKAALEDGMPGPSDPQRELHQGFAPIKVDKVIRDGEHLRLGSIELTAIATPGHTAGSTSWTWKSCEGGRCLIMVYADSLSAVSGDTYRFSDHPDEVAAFRSTIDKVGALKCDILMSPHPGASDLFERLSGKEALINPQICAAYARSARAGLDKRLSSEQAKGR